MPPRQISSPSWFSGKNRRRLLAAAAVVLLAGLILLARRPSGSDRLMAELRARGERLSLREMGLDRPPVRSTLPDVIAVAASDLATLENAATNVAPGAASTRANTEWRRQSALCQPWLKSTTGSMRDWALAESTADRIGPQLQPLHAALAQPPADLGIDYRQLLQGGNMPNYIARRRLVQNLADLVLVEARRGRMAEAHQDLVSLIRLCRVDAESCTLVSQMVRIACLGLTTQIVWEVLQAAGWTEPQLRQLQEELDRVKVLEPLPRTFEMERVFGLEFQDLYRREGPAALAVYTGNVPPARPRLGEISEYWVWRLLAVERSRLWTLTLHQANIDRSRELAAGVPFRALPPTPEVPTSWLARLAGATVPNFVRVLETATRNEADRRMAGVALACHRYALRRGRFPAALADLVPGFLERVPADPFDGRALRYLPDSPAGSLLGCVGPDGLDRLAFGSVSYSDDLRWPLGEVPPGGPGAALPSQFPPGSLLQEPGERVPLIQAQDASLADVLQNFARAIDHTLVVDPRVTHDLEQVVSFHLENISMRQAMEAIAWNHGLLVRENPKRRSVRVSK